MNSASNTIIIILDLEDLQRLTLHELTCKRTNKRLEGGEEKRQQPQQRILGIWHLIYWGPA